ncbi:50S ribosomal protein L18e [Candidatus Woesearchaeota archaeon]|nr:50S ribosomal protein L18e [Candidatus Woesearchaeota archaeon]
MKNKQLAELIKQIKTLAIKEKSKFWKRIATDLEKPTRIRRVVNVETINKTIRKGEIAVVPGKVIGTAKTENEIAALGFSDRVASNNKTLMLDELMKKCPKGQKCRIFG